MLSKRLFLSRYLGVWSLLCAASFQAGAQVHTLRGAIDGFVTDTALVPLDGATAAISTPQIEVRTGENGRFRITGLLPGVYPIVVRRVGYRPVSTIVSVRDTDTTRISFGLTPSPVTLEKVSVDASSVAPSLQDFESRRRLGRGQFLTESQIRALNFPGTIDLLRTFQSLAISKNGILNTRGFGYQACPYRIFVDGIVVATRDLETVLPNPAELFGIEVYANSAMVPLQYATFGASGNGPGGASCGVILLWSKR
jgi:hypothetical protein